MHVTWGTRYIVTSVGRLLVEEEVSSENRSRVDRQSCINSPQLPQMGKESADGPAIARTKHFHWQLPCSLAVSLTKYRVSRVDFNFFCVHFVLFVCVFASSRLPFYTSQKRKDHGAIPSMPYAFSLPKAPTCKNSL